MVIGVSKKDSMIRDLKLKKVYQRKKKASD